MTRKRPTLKKRINPYDLNDVAEARNILEKKWHGNRRIENPYDLNHDRYSPEEINAGETVRLWKWR
jgi:hypothetical protein